MIHFTCRQLKEARWCNHSQPPERETKNQSDQKKFSCCSMKSWFWNSMVYMQPVYVWLIISGYSNKKFLLSVSNLSVTVTCERQNNENDLQSRRICSKSNKSNCRISSSFTSVWQKTPEQQWELCRESKCTVILDISRIYGLVSAQRSTFCSWAVVSNNDQNRILCCRTFWDMECHNLVTSSF